MTLSERLSHPNATIRAEAKRRMEVHKQLAEFVGERLMNDHLPATADVATRESAVSVAHQRPWYASGAKEQPWWVR